MAADYPLPPLPSNRKQLEELRQWNAEMLEKWRERKDGYIRDYVMLGRWGEHPQDVRLRAWMRRLTFSPFPGEPDERLRDPRLVFMLSAPVREYLPPNRLWHCTERLRHLREDATRHNFNPRELALDVQAAVYDLFSLPELLSDRLLIAIQEQTGGRPSWDSDRSELEFRGEIIRTVGRSASNIRRVLGAFQESKWPFRIDDPLPGGKNQARVNDTVKSLNEGLSAIKFRADGSGAGFSWEVADD